MLSMSPSGEKLIMTTNNRFQDQYGSPVASVMAKVRDHLHPWVQEFIEHAPFAVMASSGYDGRCDASPKGGRPGFVKVIDETHLLIPDVRGNNLFQSYGNIDENPHVGLIFFIPGVSDGARVNGRAEVLSREELLARGIDIDDPDENAGLRQGMLVTVEEAYGHCPRALNFSRVWDVDTISANRAERPISRRPRGV